MFEDINKIACIVNDKIDPLAWKIEKREERLDLLMDHLGLSVGVRDTRFYIKQKTKKAVKSVVE